MRKGTVLRKEERRAPREINMSGETEQKKAGGKEPGKPPRAGRAQGKPVKAHEEAGTPVEEKAGVGGGATVPDAEEYEAMKARCEELAAEKDELFDKLVRSKAEFENFRKRMLKEQTRILETAESDLIKKLLPSIDNLARAVENSDKTPGNQGLVKGVKMILGQLLEILAREGLEVIDPGGEPFDPEHHEAMMAVETGECPEDTVIEVVQKGYRFNGLLIRPAMVKVSCPVKGS